MEVNLRKANALSKALLEAAKKLPLARTVSVSIYDENPSKASVDLAAEKLVENARDARALIADAFAIRADIGDANAKSGINDLLTEKARLDAEERILVAVVEPANDHTFDAATAPEYADAKLASLKKNAESEAARYGVTEELLVRVATTDVTSPMKDELLAIRRRKTAIADELLALNTTTKVVLRSGTVALLNRFKLI